MTQPSRSIGTAGKNGAIACTAIGPATLLIRRSSFMPAPNWRAKIDPIAKAKVQGNEKVFLHLLQHNLLMEDVVGVELPSLQVAYTMALTFIHGMVEAGEQPDGEMLEICNMQRNLLAIIPSRKRLVRPEADASIVAKPS